jgi:hypothetical protein
MTADDLDRLEGLLRIKLPDKYREFMLAYPAQLVDTKLNLSWTQEPISERFFRNRPQALVELNQVVRLPGTPWVDEDGPWPDRFFVIGDDQCGNYYAIDLESDGQEVWFYDHELGKFRVEQPSLQAFARQLIRETEEFNREIEQRAKKNPAK